MRTSAFQPPSAARAITNLRKRVRNLERRFPAARTMPIVLDGAGDELVPGIYGDVAIHFDGRIIRWRLLALESGSIQVDLWKTDYAGFPLTSADKNESTALTGWDVLVHDGETFRVNIDSVSGITRATLLLAIVA
jgi:hypothetical protein